MCRIKAAYRRGMLGDIPRILTLPRAVVVRLGSQISPVRDEVFRDAVTKEIGVVEANNRLRVVSIISLFKMSNSDLIMGTLNIFDHFARVLIYSSTTHSVISHMFAQKTQPHPTPLGYELEFSMP